MLLAKYILVWTYFYYSMQMHVFAIRIKGTSNSISCKFSLKYVICRVSTVIFKVLTCKMYTVHRPFYDYLFIRHFYETNFVIESIWRPHSMLHTSNIHTQNIVCKMHQVAFFDKMQRSYIQHDKRLLQTPRKAKLPTWDK